MTTEHDDYDSPWKAIIEQAFPEFMAFYFSHIHAQIDWPKGYEFKNIELRQVVRDAELGRRFADVLVSVTLRSGEPGLIYIHVEVQGQREVNFAKRIFTYNYRLYDRYDCPIASLVILADDEPLWRPDHFEFEVFGCRHSLTFPVIKLIDLASQVETLEADANPFAIVTAAHLRTRQTKGDPQARYQAKRTLVRLLYIHGWERQRILNLFAVLDWMMRLPDSLEDKLWQDIEQIEGEAR
ncbi:MAG: Rpn family recombination-promoting nuclease/putative transposase, partial [Rhodoferax sp.]|nr:Rpn family recombination-promoting nuclease/putative transposase [Rhodoferax sp.]